MAGYARDEAERAGLGITFTAVMPYFAPVTGVGRTAVQAYAARAGRPVEEYLRQHAPLLIRRSPAPLWSSWCGQMPPPWPPVTGSGAGLQELR
jgi:3-oxoacyl-[acyl-carrier protein] reductase